LSQSASNSTPFFAPTETTIGTLRDIAHEQLTTNTVITFIGASIPAFSNHDQGHEGRSLEEPLADGFSRHKEAKRDDGVDVNDRCTFGHE